MKKSKITKRRGTRKGISSTLVHMIIFIAAAILILGIITRIIPLFYRGSDMKICQASMELEKFTTTKKLCINLVDSPLKMECYRRWIKVEKDKALLSVYRKSTSPFKDSKSTPYTPLEVYDPLKKEFVETYDRLTPTLLKSIFAEELLYCWNQFFKGEVIVFPKVEVADWNILKTADNKRVCFVCSQIVVSRDALESIKKIDPQALEKFNFEDYLRKYTSPKSLGKAFSYFSELNNENSICKEDYFIEGQKYGGDCWLGYFLINGFGNRTNNIAGKSRFATIFIREGLDVCTGTEKKEEEELAIARKDADSSFFAYVVPITSIEDMKALNKNCTILLS